MISRFPRPALIALTAAAFAPNSHATLLFYEGFSADDYTEGSVNGQPYVGSGYVADGTWQSTSEFRLEGLEHPVLETTPGFHFARIAGENPTLFDLTEEGPFAAADLIGTNGKIGGTGVTAPLYFSVLARKDDPGTQDGFAGFQVYDDSQGAAGEGLGAGEVGQPNYKWLQGGSNNDIGTGTILASDETVLFVVKLDYDEVEPLEGTVWIDPDITLAEEEQDPGSFTIVPNPKPAEGFDSFRLRGNRAWSFDEIRFGTTWESVTPRQNSTPLAITAFDYVAADNSVTITWSSRPSESYLVSVSEDLETWDVDLDDGIASDGDTTTRTFDLDDALGPELGGSTVLFFRVEVQ